ncbi:MAG: glycosyltransferase family 4 protein [Halopseudomonas sp.]
MGRPKLAFYAPLKSPHHPTPSGDRLLARLLLKALEQANFEPELASSFRSYEGKGDASRQQRLKSTGQRLAQRLVRRYLRLPPSQRPKLWFTYHLYHKAPDWIGPIVCDALKIPYVVAEASYAKKQSQGPWQHGLSDCAAALKQAATIFCLNPKDQLGITQCVANAPLKTLAPFLDLTPFTALAPTERQVIAQQYNLDPLQPWLICVAMMRPGDKQHSYQLLGKALQQSSQQPWQLLIVGDGSARGNIERDFQPLTERVRFIGQQTQAQILPLLKASDLFVWPAVNEAFGMALLEAQAVGTAVLAGDEGGVSSVIKQGQSGWLVTQRDSRAFATKLNQLLQNPAAIAKAGDKAQRRVQQHHSLDKAGEQLQQQLMPLIRS